MLWVFLETVSHYPVWRRGGSAGKHKTPAGYLVCRKCYPISDQTRSALAVKESRLTVGLKNFLNTYEQKINPVSDQDMGTGLMGWSESVNHPRTLRQAQSQIVLRTGHGRFYLLLDLRALPYWQQSVHFYAVTNIRMRGSSDFSTAAIRLIA